MIIFSCNHCGQLLSINRVASGFTTNCPKCQKRVRIPMNSMTDDIITIDYQDVFDNRGEMVQRIPSREYNEELEKEKTPHQYAWQRYDTKYCRDPLSTNNHGNDVSSSN